jgi:hypothetical protein
MAYSNIKKHCKNNCGRVPVLGLSGYCWVCLPEEIKIKVGNKRDLAIKKKNARLSAISKIRGQERAKNGESEKSLWYKARRYEMIGVCMEKDCGKSTNKDNNKYFSWSVCHIVPKSLVPSVAFHSGNWIELCQEHHAKFDSTFGNASRMNCFDIAKRKFQLFKQLIPFDELRKINPNLLSEIK